MSAYSRFLKKTVKEKDICVAKMAQYCNMDRSLMYKVINGKNKISKIYAKKIANYLKLTPAECQQYYENFYKLVYGEEVYRHKYQIVDFLCNFDDAIRHPLYMEKESEIKLLDNFQIHMMESRSEINYYIKLLVEKESQKEYPSIELMTQCDNQYLMDTLLMAGKSRPNLKITHIVCLQESQESMWDNISMVKNILPFYKYQCNYEARCYYDNINSHFHNMNMFCNTLICEEGVLCYTSDYGFGQLIRDKESIRIYQKIFMQYRKETYAFMIKMKSIMEQLCMTRDNYVFKGKNRNFYTIGAEPCVLPFVTDYILDKKIHQDMPYRDQAIKLFREYINNVRGAADRGDYHVFFTMAGINYFMQGQRLLGIPHDFYDEFTQKECIDMIKKLIPYVKTGKYRILKNKLEDLSGEVEVFVSPEVCQLVFKTEEDEYAHIKINESGMVDLLYSFAEDMDEDMFLYTPEEGVCMLEEFIEKYERCKWDK